MATERLGVFISSTMAELLDVREVVNKALEDRGVQAWVFEADAGANPDDVVATSLREVEETDLYIGLFWQKYGAVTAQEFLHARSLNKPIFVYIRSKDAKREDMLENFLEAEVYDLQHGVTYDYFDSAVRLGEQIADDIMSWLVRRHREMTAELREARISQDHTSHLRGQVQKLQGASRQRLPEGTASDYLAQNLRSWFAMLGYHFEKHDERMKDKFEWLINVPARRGYDRVLVVGVAGEAGLHHAKFLRRATDQHKVEEGWLVAIQRVSQAVREEFDKKENRDLFCYTFDELIDEEADFTGYTDWLETEIKKRRIDEMYVPLAGTKEEIDPTTKERIGEARYDEHNGWIDGYIDRWLDDPSKEHISILGEFGTGKTWFALRYAWTALQRYRRAKARGVERPRLPLIIPLRDYAKAVSAESLFSEFFFRKHEIPLPGYSAFEQLNRMGKLLLIFDGFDEMAAKVDRQKMINNFWELAKVVVPGSKAILTCRTEHFPEAREGRALLSAELQSSTSSLTGEPPQFEVLHLEKFNDLQIHKVLSMRANSATVIQVMSNPKLLDLARRPVMTDFILEALPEIEAGKPIDMSRIYLYATHRKMERDIREERTFTSLADKLYFLCELSWEMLSSDRMSLNYRLFPDRLRRLLGDSIGEQKDLDHWHFDMMAQTMLIRNADGDYSPAHRSLLEFFVAYKFAAELGVLADDMTEVAKKQTHLDPGRKPIDYTWSEYFRREVNEKGTAKLVDPLRGFIAEDWDKLRETVGYMPLTKAVFDLMVNMLGPDQYEAKDRLLALIRRTCENNHTENGVAGGNMATLLVRSNRSTLRGEDLSRTTLDHAVFSNADLTNSNFHSASLRYALFYNTTLEGTDLRQSDLSYTKFAEVGAISSVSFKSDGSLFAGCGDDSNVYVWDAQTGELLLILRGHEGRVNGLAWRRNSSQLASASDDGTVRVWDTDSGVQSAELRGHSARVTSVGFSPNGQNLASGSADETVIVWSYSDGQKKLQKRFPGHVHSVRYSPDGKYIANRSRRSTVVIWSPESGEEICKLEGGAYGDAVSYIDFEPNGEKIALTVGHRFFRIWDLKTVDIVRDVGGHTARVTYMCFSPDGSQIASCDIDGLIHIFAAFDGKRLISLKGHRQRVNTVAYTPNGMILASGSDDATIKFWDIRAFLSQIDETHLNIAGADPPNPATITEDQETWPAWWLSCRVDVPSGFLPNPDFGKCLRTIEQKLNCRGMTLSGATGLNIELEEWLRERGAEGYQTRKLPT